MDVVRHAFAYKIYKLHMSKYLNDMYIDVCVYVILVSQDGLLDFVAKQLRCRFGWSVGVH